MAKTIEITCPKCKQVFEAPITQNINTALNPEAKIKLFQGSLFMLECEHCKAKIRASYPVVYNDMGNEIMIHLINSKESFDAAVTDIDNFKTMQAELAENYTFRIVPTPQEMVEKIMILERELDDRVIECLKLFHAINIKKKNPDVQIASILFAAQGQELFFQVLTKDNRGLKLPITEEQLANFTTSVKEKIDAVEMQKYVINGSYAAQVLRQEK